MKRVLDHTNELDLDSASKRTKVNDQFSSVLETVFQRGGQEYPEGWEQFYGHVMPLGYSKYNLEDTKNDPVMRWLQLFHNALVKGFDALVEDYSQHAEFQKFIHHRINGWGWLHFAAARCSKSAIVALDAAGVDLNEPTDCGESPLIVAVNSNNVEAVSALYELGCIDVPHPISGLTAAQRVEHRIAAFNDNPVDGLEDENTENLSIEDDPEDIDALEKMQSIFRSTQILPLQSYVNLRVNSNLDTMLHRVCKELDIATLDYWIQAHQSREIIVDFNIPNQVGIRPLMYAVVAEFYKYSFSPEKPVKISIRNFIRNLVNAGARLSEEDTYGCNAIDHALLQGCLTSFKVLLECGADPVALGTFRKAFYFHRSSDRMIVMALKAYIKHIDPSPFSDGKIIHLLVRLLEDEAEFLNRAIRSIIEVNKEMKCFRSDVQELQRYELINAINDLGETPIFTAVRLARVDFVKYFLNAQCNLLWLNKRSQSLWEVAAQGGNLEIIRLVEEVKQRFSTTNGIKEHFESFGCRQAEVNLLFRLELMGNDIPNDLRLILWENQIQIPRRSSNIVFSFTPKKTAKDPDLELSGSEEENDNPDSSSESYLSDSDVEDGDHEVDLDVEIRDQLYY